MHLQEINLVIEYGRVSKRGAGERCLALLSRSGPEVAMAAGPYPIGSPCDDSFDFFACVHLDSLGNHPAFNVHATLVASWNLPRDCCGDKVFARWDILEHEAAVAIGDLCAYVCLELRVSLFDSPPRNIGPFVPLKRIRGDWIQ